jgi:hypothetical protein
MQHAEQGEQVASRDLPAERCGMSDIVERLRNWRNVHLTQLRYVMESAADEIERLRLTDSERFVISEVRDTYADEDDVASNEIAAVLDWLLERTKR